MYSVRSGDMKMRKKKARTGQLPEFGQNIKRILFRRELRKDPKNEDKYFLHFIGQF